MDPVVTTFQSLINSVGTFVTASVTWIGQWATKIATTDLLVLSCVAVPLAGFGIGALARLMRRKA